MSLLRRSREPSLSYLVAGLGNPGPRYRTTRHNVGQLTAELLAEQLGGGWRSRFQARVCEVRDGEQRLSLQIPETFMNDSGRSIAPALRFWKLPASRLLVIHDELDLELGDVRTKFGGGLAGHNGLRSVADALGTNDFLRVRVGIGRPERGDPRPIADWVLQPFAPDTDVDALTRAAAECALGLVRAPR